MLEIENYRAAGEAEDPGEVSQKKSCRGIHRSVTILDKCKGIRGHKLL